jgi:hypothetical protein
MKRKPSPNQVTTDGKTPARKEKKRKTGLKNQKKIDETV